MNEKEYISSEEDLLYEELQSKVEVLYEVLKDKKKRMTRFHVETVEYKQAFEEMEETRVLYDSLNQNLKKMQRATSKPLPQQNTSLKDQLSEKITLQAKEIEKIRKILLTTTPGTSEHTRCKTELEEQEMLLKTLYVNLESIAMGKLREEEVQQIEMENDVIVELRKKIAKQVMEVEKARSNLINCGSSYEAKLDAQKRIEENITLLQALEENLDTYTKQVSESHQKSPTPSRNRSETTSSKIINNVFGTFRKSKAPTYSELPSVDPSFAYRPRALTPKVNSAPNNVNIVPITQNTAPIVPSHLQNNNNRNVNNNLNNNNNINNNNEGNNAKGGGWGRTSSINSPTSRRLIASSRPQIDNNNNNNNNNNNVIKDEKLNNNNNNNNNNNLEVKVNNGEKKEKEVVEKKSSKKTVNVTHSTHVVDQMTSRKKNNSTKSLFLFLFY